MRGRSLRGSPSSRTAERTTRLDESILAGMKVSSVTLLPYLAVVGCAASLAVLPGCSGKTAAGTSSTSSGSATVTATVTHTVTSTGGSTISTTTTSTVATRPDGSAPLAQFGKVDILFDIDNSASMGDKQTFLVLAIPEMITRLVTPRCVDSSGAPTGTNATVTGTCASGTPEFQPVSDLHIGVVTSSLGPRLGVAANGPPVSYICDPSFMVTSTAGATTSAYNDDQGHLINRTGAYGSQPALPEASPSDFLNWFPAVPANAGKSPSGGATAITQAGAPGVLSGDTLIGDFTEIVGGAGESGCGIESQLESWYRFLIQPDPYALLVSIAGKAAWSGVDTTILQQRHDFLRPDSTVAVVVLSDENDSEIDVRSYQGSGYLFLSNTYSPPRATSACATNPNSASCETCAAGSTDPSCQTNGGVYDSTDGNDWGFNLNLRHVHMMQKYGLDPQFPLSRYLNGLTGVTVPNRLEEYPTPSSAYNATPGTTGPAYTCTNPLFAAALPEASDVPDASAMTPAEIGTSLCNLPVGSRGPSNVFFAHIGGVPHQLLQSSPGDGTCPASTPAADCPQKPVLSGADWTKILGNNPATHDYTGIDPHMIESMTPRNQSGLPNSFPAPVSNPPVTSLSGPLLGTGTDPVRPDPINGREWTTNMGVHSLPVDREYACIFQLPVAMQRDCAALSASTIEGNSCDCIPGGQWQTGGAPGATGNTPDQIPPLCSMTSTDGTTITSAVNDYTVQTYAKAYPTIRELTLAEMLGIQAVVASLCPIHTVDNASGNDPLFGYRPAVDALVTRMKGALLAAQ